MIILIDLDNTLLDFNKAEENAISSVLDEMKIPNNESTRKRYSDINLSYWKKLEKKEITREELLEARFKDFFKLFNIDIDAKKINELYFSYLRKGGYPLGNAIPFLKEIKRNNDLVFIASNGVNKVQRPRIEMSGIKEYIDKTYVSEEVGYNKPDERFFKAIFNDYPKEENEYVMIGDSLSSDIAGGKNAGIYTVWFNQTEEKSSLPDLEIKDLLDFYPLYKKNKTEV